LDAQNVKGLGENSCSHNNELSTGERDVDLYAYGEWGKLLVN